MYIYTRTPGFAKLWTAEVSVGARGELNIKCTVHVEVLFGGRCFD